MVDLESATNISSIKDIEARAAYIYLDLARIIADFMFKLDSKDIPGLQEDIYLTPLLPYFLNSYFAGYSDSKFASSMAGFLNNDSHNNGLFSFFGKLPEKDGSIEQSMLPHLIIPWRWAHESDNGQEVDLTEFKEGPFASFYRSITEVAGSIPFQS